jgi:undecaprenyl-diphosphatase
VSSILQLNYHLFQKINAPAGSHPFFDALMIFCANLLIFCWPLLLLLVWGVPLNWRKRASSPVEAELLDQRRSVVLWVAFACLLAYAFNVLFPAMLTALRRPSKDSHQPTFPLLFVPILLLILAFVVACTIGVARIYVGVHYPGDILGGAIDGLIAALLITLLSRWLRQPTQAVLRPTGCAWHETAIK